MCIWKKIDFHVYLEINPIILELKEIFLLYCFMRSHPVYACRLFEFMHDIGANNIKVGREIEK